MSAGLSWTAQAKLNAQARLNNVAPSVNAAVLPQSTSFHSAQNAHIEIESEPKSFDQSFHHFKQQIDQSKKETPAYFYLSEGILDAPFISVLLTFTGSNDAATDLLNVIDLVNAIKNKALISNKAFIQALNHFDQLNNFQACKIIFNAFKQTNDYEAFLNSCLNVSKIFDNTQSYTLSLDEGISPSLAKLMISGLVKDRSLTELNCELHFKDVLQKQKMENHLKTYVADYYHELMLNFMSQNNTSSPVIAIPTLSQRARASSFGTDNKSFERPQQNFGQAFTFVPSFPVGLPKELSKGKGKISYERYDS